MFGLFKRPDPAAVASRQAARYLAALAGGSDEDRGRMLWAAHRTRVRFEEEGTVPPGHLLVPFIMPPLMLALTRAALGRARQQAVKVDDVFAVSGCDVWLFTVLAVEHPTVRVQGRDLWGMLARGIDEARELARLNHVWMPDRFSERVVAEFDGIPDGLEPRDANGDELRIGTPGMLLAERQAQRLALALAEGGTRYG